MIFAPGTRDLGNLTIWRSRTHADAPRDVDTTCITQPPVVAIAAWRVAQALPADERRAFLAELYPKLVAHHSWLYRERDLDRTGLVTLIHPWECGLDSTPPWMRAMRRMAMPAWMRTAERFHLARLLRRLRYDTRQLPRAERATDDDGLRMLAVAVHAKRSGFELRRMPRDGGVLVEDVAFNAILAAANRALHAIADELHQPVPDELDEAMARLPPRSTRCGTTKPGSTSRVTSSAGSRSPSRPSPPSCRCGRACPTGRAPTGWSVSSPTPTRSGPSYPVPSVPRNVPQFRPVRYWKGPTWLNTNWMLDRRAPQRRP